MAKIQATKIEITRAEGPSHLCGETHAFEGEDCWDKAALWLLCHSPTYPKTGGYDKHDFRVTFADGETYEGRLDCKHLSCSDPDLNVAKHVRDFCEFSAGLRRPAWMEDKHWHSFLQRHEASGDLKEYREFLDAYEIPAQ